MTILVTGGPGTLGRCVVDRLLDAALPLRILARTAPAEPTRAEFFAGDLSTGAGVAVALDGVTTVVHCAGSAKGDAQRAATLVAAAREAGVGHLVYISVVGADRVPVRTRTDRTMFGYFEQKRAAEVIIEESGIPFTILRATQFHELLLLVAQSLVKLPVVPLPRGLRAQPVAAAEVADRLVHLATGDPAGLVPDFAGPRVVDAAELLRAYLRALGKRRLIIRTPLPGGAAAAMLGGANLSPEQAVGRLTWEEFLGTTRG